jgi:nitrogen fixation protein FixH
MLPVLYVLMVLAPTTKTGPVWHPYMASASKEDCESEAKLNMESWNGKTPIDWKCVRYKLDR